jgi:hypothetical protein
MGGATHEAERSTLQGTGAPGPPGTAAGDNWSEALKWRSHTAPESVACSVQDVVLRVRITADARREHDTDGGYEHEP